MGFWYGKIGYFYKKLVGKEFNVRDRTITYLGTFGIRLNYVPNAIEMSSLDAITIDAYDDFLDELKSKNVTELMSMKVEKELVEIKQK